MRILVSTTPFGTVDVAPRTTLEKSGWEFVVNEKGREFTEEEMVDIVEPFDGIVAGTEPITRRVLERARNLKIVARVGVGLDSVDLVAARQRGVAVSYTPEAPAPAVAELAVGLMLDTLRGISRADRRMRLPKWEREMGRRLSECVVGIMGVGRIGRRVIRHLSGFGAQILAHDLAPDRHFGIQYGVEWVGKQELLRRSDVVSLHVPLTSLTRHFIGEREFCLMKGDAVLINTARGPIVDLKAMEATMCAGGIGGAGIDVYDREPYEGPLTELNSVVLTSHMASCSRDCRLRMETEATEECVRYLAEGKQGSPVPEVEYEMRQEDVRYVVQVTPDATFHHLGASDVLASDSPGFRDYRRRWFQNPAEFRVEGFPLHVDVEVVGPHAPAVDKGVNLIDFFLVERILQEGRANGLCGVKFGFRGNPFLHPRLPEMVALAKEYGILDVYIKADAVDLAPDLAVSLVMSGLDRITLTVQGDVADGTLNRTWDIAATSVENLRRVRESMASYGPRIRVQTYVTAKTVGIVDAFAEYWRVRADEVAYVDLDYHQLQAPERGIEAEWACAKPWQSLCVAWTGEILCCNHDFKSEAHLGKVGETSLSKAWGSAEMKKLRSLHEKGSGHEAAICDKCVLRYCEITRTQRR